MTQNNPKSHPDASEPEHRQGEQSDFAQEDWIALDHLLDESTPRGRDRAPWAWDPETIELEPVEASLPKQRGDHAQADESDAAFADAHREDGSTRTDIIQEEDIQDDMMVLSVPQRHIRIVPGEAVEMRISLLNNGQSVAPFTLQLEGFVQDDWFSIEPKHTQLRPGETGQFTLTIAPPRLASSRAGTFPLHISARSTSYPQRRSRIGTRLTIDPFTAFSLGELHPAHLSAFWHAPECTALLPITNGSNAEAHIYLEGSDGRHAGVGRPGQAQLRGCRIEFLLPGSKAAHTGHAMIAMAPGQTLHAAVRISPRHRRPFGLRRQAKPFRITGWIAPVSNAAPMQAAIQAGPNAQQSAQWGTARTVSGRLTTVPLIGPGAVTAMVGCGLLALLAVGAVTVALLFTLLLPDMRTPQSASAPAPSVPAAVEIVVKIAEPVPTAVEDAPVAVAGRSGATGAAPDTTSVAPAAVAAPVENAPMENAPVESAPNGAPGATTLGPEGVPLVQPNMVTAPGETVQDQSVAGQSVAVQSGALNADPATAPTPVVVTSGAAANPATNPGAAPAVTTGDATTMTYEQMFRTVGDQYGLDWRLLAAQAYVESGFNPVALGSQGDLGLMQVLPATWQEWAPQVDATDPFDSYSNVRVAAAYLDYLRTLLDQRNGHAGTEWMLVAYNWGPNQLQEFLNSGASWDALDESRRKYANDIMAIAESLPTP